MEIAPDRPIWPGFLLLASLEAVPLAPQGRYITAGGTGGILDGCGLTENVITKKKRPKKKLKVFLSTEKYVTKIIFLES